MANTGLQAGRCSGWYRRAYLAAQNKCRMTTQLSYRAVFVSNAFNKLLGAARHTRVNQQNLKLRHSAHDNKATNSPVYITTETQLLSHNTTTAESKTVLFFSRPRSDCWPHHGRTFSIYLWPLSFWLTLPRGVLSTSWCCPSRPCVVFLACVHLALSLSPGNFTYISMKPVSPSSTFKQTGVVN